MSLTGGPIDFLTAFFAGVVVSFTPCVYPVVPIVAAAIAGANTSGRAWGGFFLSLLYVLGLALSYSLLAFFAAWTGKFFGAFQNNPWVFLAVGNVILVFALVMLDVIPFPTFSLGGPVRRKGTLPIFVMGFASGF
ncbi:MAG: sulfite exporter TauE/SafE family protein, partial [Candidatus Omnitrophica bacterium]|nr:sulfite exporter TauE/SafE family protein [Candidatus Omnitrophota bacterium]